MIFNTFECTFTPSKCHGRHNPEMVYYTECKGSRVISTHTIVIGYRSWTRKINYRIRKMGIHTFKNYCQGSVKNYQQKHRLVDDLVHS